MLYAVMYKSAARTSTKETKDERSDLHRIYNPRDFARAQARVFEEDLKHSRRITLQEWEGRPWTEKLWENTLGLLSSQL